jgi:hypothetical protein
LGIKKKFHQWKQRLSNRQNFSGGKRKKLLKFLKKKLFNRKSSSNSNSFICYSIFFVSNNVFRETDNFKHLNLMDTFPTEEVSLSDQIRVYRYFKLAVYQTLFNSPVVGLLFDKVSDKISIPWIPSLPNPIDRVPSRTQTILILMKYAGSLIGNIDTTPAKYIGYCLNFAADYTIYRHANILDIALGYAESKVFRRTVPIYRHEYDRSAYDPVLVDKINSEIYKNFSVPMADAEANAHKSLLFYGFGRDTSRDLRNVKIAWLTYLLGKQGELGEET